MSSPQVNDLSMSMPVIASPDRTKSFGSTIELLKVYRYNIAPWLDICDPKQPFGVTLLTELNKMPGLRACIMQLAAVTPNMPQNNESSSMADFTSDVAEDAVVRVLATVGGVVLNLAASWLSEDGVENRRNLLENLLLDLGRSDINIAAYWLLVRLGMRDLFDLYYLLC